MLGLPSPLVRFWFRVRRLIFALPDQPSGAPNGVTIVPNPKGPST